MSNRYFLGGFLIGAGLHLIYNQLQTDKQNKIWEDAANGIQEPIVPTGEHRSSDRDRGIGIRNLRDNGPEHSDNSRDGRARRERGSGEEESSD